MAPVEAVQARLISLDETAVAVRSVGAAGATEIPDWVALIPEVVSVTVKDWVPAVSNVSEKDCTPDRCREIALRRQDGGGSLLVNAPCRITGRHVVVGILGGDREGLNHADGRGRGEAGEDELAGGGRADADRGARAGDHRRRGIRRGDVWLPAVSSVTSVNVYVPSSAAGK